VQRTMIIPNSRMGNVMGEQNTNIKMVRIESGATVSVQKLACNSIMYNKNWGNSEECWEVIVTGTEEAAATAQRMIDRLANNSWVAGAASIDFEGRVLKKRRRGNGRSRFIR